MSGIPNRLFWMSVALSLNCIVVNLSGLIDGEFHQWAGVVLTALLGAHMIMHRKWFMTSLRRAKNLKGRAHTNFRLALALGVTYTATIVSGFAVIPALHDGTSPESLTHLHALFAVLSVGFTVRHVALHWPWLCRNATRLRLAVRHA